MTFSKFKQCETITAIWFQTISITPKRFLRPDCRPLAAPFLFLFLGSSPFWKLTLPRTFLGSLRSAHIQDIVYRCAGVHTKLLTLVTHRQWNGGLVGKWLTFFLYIFQDLLDNEHLSLLRLKFLIMKTKKLFLYYSHCTVKEELQMPRQRSIIWVFSERPRRPRQMPRPPPSSHFSSLHPDAEGWFLH